MELALQLFKAAEADLREFKSSYKQGVFQEATTTGPIQTS